jgi:hypothetical protein
LLTTGEHEYTRYGFRELIERCERFRHVVCGCVWRRGVMLVGVTTGGAWTFFSPTSPGWEASLRPRRSTPWLRPMTSLVSTSAPLHPIIICGPPLTVGRERDDHVK